MAKDVARMANRSEPAAYGNLGGGVTTNYSRPCGLMLHQHVDVIWNEDTGPLAGHRNYSASLSLKISEAAGTMASAGPFSAIPVLNPARCLSCWWMARAADIL